MIDGKPFTEEVVLRVGYAFEQATNWHLRAPISPGWVKATQEKSRLSGYDGSSPHRGKGVS